MNDDFASKKHKEVEDNERKIDDSAFCNEEQCSQAAFTDETCEDTAVGTTEQQSTFNSRKDGQARPVDTVIDCENWRGMAKPISGQKRRNTYLTPQSDWCAGTLSNSRKALKLGILQTVIGLS